MKRFAILAAVLLMGALLAAPACAQSNNDKNHGDFGVYLDYTRLSFADLNLFGVGGRVGFNVHPHVALEGEMAYDFERSTTQTISNAFFTTTVRSDIRLIHGLFGPKIQTTGRPVRLFGVLKGGLLNLSVGGPVTISGVTSSFGNIQDGDTKGVLYPGGGIEFNGKHFGVRVEAGDEIFWSDGAHNNFKLMAGPTIRF